MRWLMAKVWKFALWDYGSGIFILTFVLSVVVASVGELNGWLPPYVLLAPFIISVGVLVVGWVIMVVMLHRWHKEDAGNVKTRPNTNHI